MIRPGRREALVGFLAGAATLYNGTTRPSAAKKKRKKKKKRPCPECAVCPPPPPPPSPPTCAETCPSMCAVCVTRPGAPLLCGDSVAPDCNSPCSSHADCDDPDQPYCVSQRVTRSTGDVVNMCEPDPTGGFCSSVTACA
jgi:hypothetical protein